MSLIEDMLEHMEAKGWCILRTCCATCAERELEEIGWPPHVLVLSGQAEALEAGATAALGAGPCDAHVRLLARELSRWGIPHVRGQDGGSTLVRSPSPSDS